MQSIFLSKVCRSSILLLTKELPTQEDMQRKFFRLPKPKYLKINMDAGVGISVTTFAIVIRNNLGNLVFLTATSWDYKEVDMAELRALEWATRQAFDFNWNKVVW